MKQLPIALCCVLLSGAPVWSQGKKPEQTNSQSNQPTHPVKSAKDTANEALNNVDSGLHKAGSAAKAGAEKALDAVDQSVHKVVGSDSQSSK
jgi:hypothetical protein